MALSALHGYGGHRKVEVGGRRGRGRQKAWIGAHEGGIAFPRRCGRLWELGRKVWEGTTTVGTPNLYGWLM